MKKQWNVALLCLTTLGLVACGDGEKDPAAPSSGRDSSSWFSQNELEEVGLSGLASPVGCDEGLYTDIAWYNGGYAFHQSCSDVAVLETNARAYLSYFESRYKNRFGKASFYAFGEQVNYYRIVASSALSDYFDDNPSPLYRLYYVCNDGKAEDGYLKEDAVWSFKVRYETGADGQYQLKGFIENASKSHNGAYTYKYVLA